MLQNSYLIGEFGIPVEGEKPFEMKGFFCYTGRRPQGEDVMSTFNKVKNAALGLFVVAGMASCDKPGGGVEPGPGPIDPGKVTSYNVTGKAAINFYKADSSLLFWQKIYGATAADDKFVQAKISASTKAKGDVVNFENKLITADNISRVSSSGNLAYFRDYNLGTAVFAEGKNIGKTADGKNVIKDMRFSGTDDNFLMDTNLNDVLGILNNPDLKWKLEGDKATGYGGADKVYALKVN